MFCVQFIRLALSIDCEELDMRNDLFFKIMESKKPSIIISRVVFTKRNVCNKTQKMKL
jgi:hypothetical protein